MAALIPGFEYDIFISYRHNDEEWMAEFMPKLRNALKTRIGKELNIFYDQNLSDGLGATHEVRASLDHRVANSVILLPLISATYCDTEKYSWQHEFLPFLEHAERSPLGLKLNLPGGAQVSRVLALRTYNLEEKHSRLLQQTLGGFLRSVDFVYEAKEVNRPLEVRDDDSAFPTANNLLYRNQISTLASSIKDLLEAAEAATKKTAALGVSPSAAALSVTFPSTAPLSMASPTIAAPSMAAPPVAAAPTGPKVFLAWTASKLKARREQLEQVCAKAGLNVVNVLDCPLDEDEFRAKTQEGLAAADCSVHLLGNWFGQRFEEDSDTSFPMYAYHEARRQAAERPGFQQVVWYSPDAAVPVDKAQEAFVSQIRNELTARCTFSSAPDAPQLVQELRTALVPAAPPPACAVKETDICFIANALDRPEAEAIVDRLCDDYDYNLAMLTIAPNNADYKEMMTQAIPKSRLAVVYYKDSGDWALPFLKQVYQLVGGANSPTPFLFVGEAEHPEQSGQQGMRTKNLISRFLPHEGVSDEVQRVYQKVNTSPA